MKRAPLFARFLALCIDWVILSILCALIFIAVLTGYISGANGSLLQNILSKSGLLLKMFLLFAIVVVGFYFTYLNMNGRATAGKSLFRIKVLKSDGTELGFIRSFTRFVMYIFSVLVFFSGFIIAFFLKGKTLHDILADTRVIEEEL